MAASFVGERNLNVFNFKISPCSQLLVRKDKIFQSLLKLLHRLFLFSHHRQGFLFHFLRLASSTNRRTLSQFGSFKILRSWATQNSSISWPLGSKIVKVFVGYWLTAARRWRFGRCCLRYPRPWQGSWCWAGWCRSRSSGCFRRSHSRRTASSPCWWKWEQCRRCQSLPSRRRLGRRQKRLEARPNVLQFQKKSAEWPSQCWFEMSRAFLGSKMAEFSVGKFQQLLQETMNKMFRSELVFKRLYPTGPFTMLEHHEQEVCEDHRTYFEAPKLWKGQSGT